MGLAQFNSNNFTSSNNITTTNITSSNNTTNTDTRKTYFADCGENIYGASNLKQALHLSELDYKVEKTPLYMKNSQGIEFQTKNYATYTTKSNDPNSLIHLGTVGESYKILQNEQAFDFLDTLTKQGSMKYETAGHYDSMKKSFITCSTEPLKILGDDFENYILFTNSFDGKATVKVTFTPTRVFCSNCISLVLKNAKNTVSIRHTNDMFKKLEISKEILLDNTNYLQALKAESERLATTPFSQEAFEALALTMFKADENDTSILRLRNEEQLEALFTAYKQADLQNFNNTAYKAIQAMADFESHKKTFRKLKEENTKDLVTVINGMPLLNQMYNMIKAKV